MKPIIGILMRPGKTETNRDISYVYDSVRNVIENKRATSLGIVPPHLGELKEEEIEALHKIVDFCDGIIAQGGDDFYPYDTEVIQYAYEKNIPVLGLCLGMQTMAMMKNGTLQNLEDTKIHMQKGTDFAHAVRVKPDSMYYKIVGETDILVNSRHRQYIEKTDLLVSGISQDGIIEVVEDRDKDFFIGVQWHPEDLFTYDIVSNKLFDYFINICKR